MCSLGLHPTLLKTSANRILRLGRPLRIRGQGRFAEAGPSSQIRRFGRIVVAMTDRADIRRDAVIMFFSAAIFGYFGFAGLVHSAGPVALFKLTLWSLQGGGHRLRSERPAGPRRPADRPSALCPCRRAHGTGLHRHWDLVLRRRTLPHVGRHLRLLRLVQRQRCLPRPQTPPTRRTAPRAQLTPQSPGVESPRVWLPRASRRFARAYSDSLQIPSHAVAIISACPC